MHTNTQICILCEHVPAIIWQHPLIFVSKTYCTLVLRLEFDVGQEGADVTEPPDAAPKVGIN